MKYTALALALLTLSLKAGAAPDKPAEPGFGERPGESSVAVDANRLGQVAGVIEDGEGRRRAVVYAQGRVAELGTLGGSDSYTTAINASGLVTGSAQNAEGRWRAFIHTPGQGMRGLDTLGGNSSHGLAINQLGHVAGHADVAGGDFHAMVFDGVQMRDLGTLGGKTSYATSINSAGQVVGTAQNADGYRRAFLYQPGQGMVELPSLGGRTSSAAAINDAGLIAGTAETADRRMHAFVYDGKTMIDLGAKIGHGTNTYATGINAAGHVVGSVTAQGFAPLTFVYREGRISVHPREAGLYLTNKINDSGLVVGAKFSGQRLQAFGVDEVAPVKETSPWDWAVRCVLLAAAAITLVKVHRRASGSMFPTSSVRIVSHHFVR